MRTEQSFTSPCHLITSSNVLDETTLNLMQNDAHKSFSEPLGELTKNPNDSQLRHVVKLIDKGVTHDDVDQTVSHALLGACEEMMSNLNAQYEGDLGAFDKEKLTVVECWDEEGYENPMHLDSERKIWTGVIYLFGQGNSVEGGTSFFRKDSKGDFSKFFAVTPQPNHAAYFISDKNSYHAVEPALINRHVLIVNYNHK